MVRSLFKEYYKPYWWLCVLRVFLVFMPQTGYIHPDEYFQTVEVLAGKIFELDASLPWEFNATSPIRSMGVPCLTIGFSYKIMKTIDLILRSNFNTTILTPYFLLIVPRLFLCLMSFLIDYSLYKICISNNEKYRSRLLILASSYVTIVFGTHTFTNTIEMFLFAILLYYVAESMIFSNIIVRQREYINKRYNKASNPAERAKFHKLRLFLASDSYRSCFPISTITVLGFFNRPTFLCYSVFPIFFWLYRGIGFKSVTTMQFHARILILIGCAIPTILALILIDSFFYGYISWGEIGMFDISIDSFVFPPLNFMKYNMNNENLAKHVLHPRYLHILVNVPLLFNVLGIFAMIGIMDIIIKLWKKKYHMLPTVRSIRGLMMASFIAPIAALSVFPHQEPRFLLPIIIPLVYLYANAIHKERDYGLVKSSKETFNKEILEKKAIKSESNSSFNLWMIVNILCIIYFGFLQQGGIYPATSYLSQEINQKPYFNYHIVTSHIYSIPHVLFLQPSSEKLFYKKGSTYQMTKHVYTYERGSKNLEELCTDIVDILDTASNNKRRYKVYLVLTGALHEELMAVAQEQDFPGLHILHKSSFYPHVSLEAPPDISKLIDLIGFTDVKNISFTHIYECICNIFKSFSLNVYEISFPNSRPI